jgi:F-type H+-transporting ATPase subunit b
VPAAADLPADHKGSEHSSSGLPQFNPASWPSQIFWLTIIFGSFYALSSFWIVPKMGSIVTARADYISDNLKQAETLSNEAHHIKHDYESDLKTSHIKANETIQSIHETSKARLNASVTEFRQTYERDIAATESMIKKAQDDAMVDMNKIVATVASSAAEKIAGISTDKAQAENVVKLLNDKRAKAA